MYRNLGALKGVSIEVKNWRIARPRPSQVVSMCIPRIRRCSKFPELVSVLTYILTREMRLTIISPLKVPPPARLTRPRRSHFSQLWMCTDFPSTQSGEVLPESKPSVYSSSVGKQARTKRYHDRTSHETKAGAQGATSQEAITGSIPTGENSVF